MGLLKQFAQYCIQMHWIIPSHVFLPWCSFLSIPLNVLAESGVHLVRQMLIACSCAKEDTLLWVTCDFHHHFHPKSPAGYVPGTFSFSFALSVVPTLVSQNRLIIFSVPMEYNGCERVVSSGNYTHVLDKVTDCSHTLFTQSELTVYRNETISKNMQYLALVTQSISTRKQSESKSKVNRTLEVCLCLCCVYVCSRALMVLSCPPLHSEAVFWTGAQDRAWGTLLRFSLSRAPTLTDITSARET